MSAAIPTIGKIYKELALDIVEWNKSAGKFPQDFERESALGNQWLRVEEEVLETLAAVEAEDVIEVLDGLCDIFVVASYHLYISGEAELDSAISTSASAMSLDQAYNGLERVRVLSAEARRTSLGSPPAKELNRIARIAFVSALRLGEGLGFDFIGAIRAVNDNNATKFLDDPDVAKVHAERYASEKGEAVDVFASTYRDKPCFILLRLSDRKIMKPFEFVGVDLIPFVY